MYIDQLSIFIDNRPGTAALVFDALSTAQVNVRAMSLSDAGNFGILRMIVDDIEKAEEALDNVGVTKSRTKVLAISMGDSPGSLSKILDLLGSHGFNVEYAYAFIAREENAAVLILRVEDADQAAARMLVQNGVHLLSRCKPGEHCVPDLECLDDLL